MWVGEGHFSMKSVSLLESVLVCFNLSQLGKVALLYCCERETGKYIEIAKIMTETMLDARILVQHHIKTMCV